MWPVKIRVRVLTNRVRDVVLSVPRCDCSCTCTFDECRDEQRPYTASRMYSCCSRLLSIVCFVSANTEEKELPILFSFWRSRSPGTCGNRLRIFHGHFLPLSFFNSVCVFPSGIINAVKSTNPNTRSCTGKERGRERQSDRVTECSSHIK